MTNPHGRGLILAFLFVFTAPAEVARAQGAPDSAAAEELFQDGKRLLKAGRTREACEAFEGSQRLEPRPSTLLNLADCRERNGQLATAWVLYLEAASAARAGAGRADLEESARKKAAAVQPRVSQLVVQVPDASRAPGLAITRDGAPIDPALWNRAQPLDGGSYVIAARAPGRELWSMKVDVAAAGGQHAVSVPRLPASPAQAPAPAAPASASPAPGPGDGAAAEARRPAGMPARRKVALGLASAAAAGLAGAIALELSGRSTYARYEELTTPSPERDALYDRANRKHQLAQGLAAGGAAAAVAAVVLWVTAPSSARGRSAALAPRVHAGAGFAGASLQGSF
jgi:hypothetical protein